MPSLETEDLVENIIGDESRSEKTLSGPIGIIYPPPEVRSILNLKRLKISKHYSQKI